MSDEPWQTALRRQVWLVVWGVAALAVTGAVVAVTDEPRLTHTNALNAVFDTRWMVAGSRVLACTVFIWAMLSIGVRVSRGQWIRTLGPVTSDARDSAERLVASQRALQEALGAADARIVDLQQGAGSDALVQQDRARIKATLDEAQRVRAAAVPELRRAGVLRRPDA